MAHLLMLNDDRGTGFPGAVARFPGARGVSRPNPLVDRLISISLLKRHFGWVYDAILMPYAPMLGPKSIQIPKK